MSNEVKNNASNNNHSRRNLIRSLADGSLFTKEVILKHILFLLYLLFLGIVFIANRYHSEKLVRETIDLKKEIEELKAEQLTVTSAFMQMSQQSEVEKLIQMQQLDLQNSEEPPKKIILPKQLCQR